MKNFILPLILLAILLGSCRYVTGKKIRGNGNVIKQERQTGSFTGVEVDDAIYLYVKTDSVFSVKVETDENLQQHIRMEMEGDILKIREEVGTNLDATGKIAVFITAPFYRRLKASGASHIVSESLLNSPSEMLVDVSGASVAELELKAPVVAGEMSGASKLNLRGQTRDLRIKGSGASRARCFELLAENTVVHVSGASNADVFASVNLDAKASGASDIRYKGNAATVARDESGAGSIKKAE